MSYELSASESYAFRELRGRLFVVAEGERHDVDIHIDHDDRQITIVPDNGVPLIEFVKSAFEAGRDSVRCERNARRKARRQERRKTD